MKDYKFRMVVENKIIVTPLMFLLIIWSINAPKPLRLSAWSFIYLLTHFTHNKTLKGIYTVDNFCSSIYALR